MALEQFDLLKKEAITQIAVDLEAAVAVDAQAALLSRNEAEGFSQTANTRAGEANLSAIDAADSAQDALDYRNAAEQIVSAYFLYNITVAIPLTAGNYYTLTTAIAATPVNVRKLGLVITFADSATTWLTYKFIGTDVSGWSTVSNWQRVIHERELIPDELVISEAINALLKRIEDLESVIKNAVFENLQIDTLTTVKDLKYNGASLILTGTIAPSITPDFVGQFFINTTGGTTYQAKGTANAADWKQTA